MTDTTNLTSFESDAGVVAELAEQAAARELVQVDTNLAVLVHGDNQTIHEFDLEQYRDEPSRKKGRVTLTDADSFVEYVKRHTDPRGTTIWADLEHSRIIAVLDDHERVSAQDKADGEQGDGESFPGWGQHRATLQLGPTVDWTHWLSNDGKYLEQTAFAEHIEDGVDAIVRPEPATMLEIAQTFHANSGVNFSSSRRLSGDVELKYEETTGARAGETGTIEIPETFELGISPFEGTDRYKIDARFRYRLGNGRALLGYRLIRPDRALRSAFHDIVTTVAEGTGLTVLAGTPRIS